MLLQRAASNAYSWWWASHIRTTQSKWLDANLQEMEHRVKIMLKLLGEEADSFGKRAEMYYRRRPEVINHVEEVYRAYRALVERYDHLSKELHKANHTIATACPEQVQYAMLEEDESFPKAITPINSRNIQKSTVEEILKRKKEGPSGRNKGVHERSGPHMGKDKAEEEISRLQKAILVLQTEKEFVKSSYESGIANYWEIEKQIADMQEEICHIQDEFDVHAAIEDDEARALMMITALRSCHGTVAKLVESFEDLIRIATMESEKIKSLQEKLYAMNSNTDPSTGEVGSTNMTVYNRVYPITQEILELQPIYEKIENIFENISEPSAEEMAEKVDELVDKVMNLELKFPKQYAQIKQLKEENKNLKNKLDDLQDEMALRDDPSDLSEQLKLVEDELNRISILERSIIEEEALLSTTFSEVFSCITNISKAFGPIGPEDLAGLSAAAGDGATPSEDVCMENFTKDSTSMKGGESRDIEALTTCDNLGRDICSKEDVSEVVDHYSPGGTDGILDSRNSYKENFPTENSLMQEEFRDKESVQAGNHIDLIVSSDNKNGFNRTCEGKTDSSSEEVDHSSSVGMNKNRHMGNDGIENFESNEEGLSVEVAESSFGGSNKTQDLKIDGDENPVPVNSLIQQGGLRDGKSPRTCGQISLAGSANLYSLSKGDATEENSIPEAAHSCFNDADKSLDLWHADEAKSVEELPKQCGQLIAPENIKGFNECSKVDSSEEGDGTSLGHMNIVENLNDSVLVGASSSEVSDGTSLCWPDRNSEETERMCRLVSEVPTNSENMDSHISHSQLAKKNSNVKVLAREASTLSNHGSRSRPEKSTLAEEDDVPSWQEFLLDGLEGRDTILLADYTSILRNYKETKRRLAEMEKKNQEHLEETKAVIRELKNANSMKYVEIQSLKNLLDSSEMPLSKMGTDRSNQTLGREISIVEETNLSHTAALEDASPFQVKFRTEIDGLVEENLQFLVSYSMACHRMQDLDRKYHELQNEIENFEDKKTGEPDSAAEPEPAEKKLRELKTELDVWFEQNALLDQDLQLKTTSLCRLQEEIAEALRAGSEIDGARFTPYEAAKFQGEVLNMQQSNNKIESVLQAALERMRELQAKMNDALRKLHESFELSSRRSSRTETESSYHNQFKHFPGRTRVPLRNFLFGTKPKKKSIFACINPTLQKQFSDL